MILSFSHVARHFEQGGQTVYALRHVDFELKRGEIVGLVGSSGSGKSTLLHIAGLLDTPSQGQVILDGREICHESEKERARLRCKYMGFVYQFHHLLPEFNAIDNVVIPQLIWGVPYKQARERAEHLLTRLHLSHRFTHYPHQLSGGEQQRVAIARAIANYPKLLLADEPTGNLDFETTQHVFSELLGLVREENLTALIATHDLSLAGQMDRMLHLKNGCIDGGNGQGYWK
jgi:lipoprotein-releasing system ATP-binding protein